MSFGDGIVIGMLIGSALSWIGFYLAEFGDTDE